MSLLRNPAHDPRTVARDIPGVLDAVFPQLAQGVVASINRRSKSLSHLQEVPQEVIEGSDLQKAMLFELAIAAAENLLGQSRPVDWESCLQVAAKRQQRHFDAKVPARLSEADRRAALLVATNLVEMLDEFKSEAPTKELCRSPKIPGYQWIESGVGDFSIGTTLIEIKCTNKHFSSSDYRQVLMYWLLSYCSAIEGGQEEWLSGILANPRLNLFVKFEFYDVISIISAGRSKVEILELFSAIVGSRVEL